MYFEFVNRINRDSFKDLHASRKSVKWKTIIIFCILFAFFLCVYVINKQLLFGFLSIFFGFLFAFMLFIKMPFYINDKKLVEDYLNNILKETIIISDEYLEIINETSKNKKNYCKIYFSDIISFDDVNDLLIIMCSGRNMYLINKRSLNNIVALDFLKNRLGNLKSHTDASINKIMPEYKKEEEIFNDSHNITFRYNEKSYEYLKKNLFKRFLIINITFLIAFALSLIVVFGIDIKILLPVSILLGVLFLSFLFISINILIDKKPQVYYYYIMNLSIDENSFFITSYVNSSVYKSEIPFDIIMKVFFYNGDLVIEVEKNKYYYIDKQYLNDDFLKNLKKHFNI